MNRYDKRVWVLATCLSALAGYVDALGFIRLGGFFVSFMSGNSTQVGVGVAQGDKNALIAGSLVVVFLVGVITGSLTGHFFGRHRRAAVLLLVSALLAAGAGLHMAGVAEGAVIAMALAMGAENAAFERDGEVSIGLTYMTGTLVKLGQRITGAMLGGPRMAWAPHLLLWLGLVVGATAGAAAYPLLGLNGLWIASGAAAILAIASAA